MELPDQFFVLRRINIEVLSLPPAKNEENYIHLRVHKKKLNKFFFKVIVKKCNELAKMAVPPSMNKRN